MICLFSSKRVSGENDIKICASIEIWEVHFYALSINYLILYLIFLFSPFFSVKDDAKEIQGVCGGSHLQGDMKIKL